MVDARKRAVQAPASNRRKRTDYLGDCNPCAQGGVVLYVEMEVKTNLNFHTIYIN